MSSTKYYEREEEVKVLDSEGNVQSQAIRTTRRMRKDLEPEYIKIYTQMWCKFVGVSEKYSSLFLSLATRMSYCSKDNLEGSQIVALSPRIRKAICEECGWKSDHTLAMGLAHLCSIGAIKRLSRGEYQINPMYAGKGPWQYDSRKKQGGIENLVATFDFKDRQVNTSITWDEDDAEDKEYVREVVDDMDKRLDAAREGLSEPSDGPRYDENGNRIY